MTRVAITGVSGYVGSRLLARLDRAPFVESITGVDVRPPKSSSNRLRFYRRDILDPLTPVFIENGVDSAIHLAFVLKATHDWKGASEIDVGGTASFLEACRQARVRHILYLSSHTVYGARPDNQGFLTEQAPLRPLPGFQYAEDKVKVESLLQDFARSNGEVCLTILRSCPVIGPNAAGSAVDPLFKPVMIRVAGYDPPMQFVHEDDLVELIVTMLAQPRAGIYNVAGDGELRYTRIASLCRSPMAIFPEWLLHPVMGLTWALRLQKESPASGLAFIKYPPLVSTEKLKQETGFKFRYSAEEAVISFLAARR